MVVECHQSSQSLNFSKKNLKGHSFKRQNLTGANFSYSDIRGADFTGANLTNTDFSNTTAGLNNYVVFVSFLLLLAIGFFTGAVAVLISSLICSNNYNNLITGIITLTGCITFLIISIREGFANTFITVVGTTASLGILAGFVSVAFNYVEIGNITLDTANKFALNIFAVFLITVFLSLIAAILNTKKVVTISLVSAFISIIFISTFSTGEIAHSISIKQKGLLGIFIAIGIAILIITLCASISRHTLAGDRNHIFIKRIALKIAAIGGTSFRGANLTGANFTESNLRNTDFREANLTHTIWFRAKKLELAILDQTILDNPAVRDLLVNRNPSNTSYENTCLEGAYLVDLDLREVNFKNANLSKAKLEGANLSKADLTQANLTEANLRGVNLEESILTKTQAIETDFRQAYFTGACGLGTWNINHTTKLDGINCHFVYLGGKNDKRRPQSGQFAPGEFTKMFQVVINTVDLIFRNSLNLKILSATLEDVQTINQTTPLKIQSIEDKGDEFVVVKVSVPEELDQVKIHSELKRSYKRLRAIQKKYFEINQILTEEDSQAYQIQVQADKLVVLAIGEGDFVNGFPVTAFIQTKAHQGPMIFTGKLPPETNIPKCYQQWRQLYHSQKWFGRITFDEKDVVTNFSEQELNYYTYEMEKCLNNWLNSQAFRPIDKQLYSKLVSTEELLLIIQTKNIQLQRLPWHLWSFFKDYQKAEVALSFTGEKKEKLVPPKDKIKILTILGNSTGIDVEVDRKVLEKLPQSETVFLVEPTLQKLHQELWDEQGWDIFCFSGHSLSLSQPNGSRGIIFLNQTKLLTIKELKYALTKAIERGLQLAIFNSCDGLGLARELSDLHIPQIIVMREPVPDKVAQEFLKYFLTAFSNGKSLYASVREARERLEGLEDDFPCATWLPVIFQNSAEVNMSWGKYQG